MQALVNDPVDLYPTRDAQIQLCDGEAEVMQNEEILPALKEISAQQDKLLNDAIEGLQFKAVREPNYTIYATLANALWVNTKHNTWNN